MKFHSDPLIRSTSKLIFWFAPDFFRSIGAQNWLILQTFRKNLGNVTEVFVTSVPGVKFSRGTNLPRLILPTDLRFLKNYVVKFISILASSDHLEQGFYATTTTTLKQFQFFSQLIFSGPLGPQIQCYTKTVFDCSTTTPKTQNTVLNIPIIE